MDLNQFDSYTLVHFEDDSYYISFAPKTLSLSSVYGRSTTPGATDNLLKFRQSSVMADYVYKEASEDDLNFFVIISSKGSYDQTIGEYRVEIS